MLEELVPAFPKVCFQGMLMWQVSTFSCFLGKMPVLCFHTEHVTKQNFTATSYKSYHSGPHNRVVSYRPPPLVDKKLCLVLSHILWNQPKMPKLQMKNKQHQKESLWCGHLPPCFMAFSLVLLGFFGFVVLAFFFSGWLVGFLFLASCNEILHPQSTFGHLSLHYMEFGLSIYSNSC